MLWSVDKAHELLRKYGLAFPKTALYGKHQELTFPVVLKIDSPEILHKIDRGLVLLNLNSEAELTNSVMEEEKKLKGIRHHWIVQEMVKGVEILVGMKRDQTFGPVIVFGLGGVFVEVLKDIAMELAPITPKEALCMIGRIKGGKILEGYRGLPPVNKEQIVYILTQVSHMALNEPEITEIDFNPVIINEKGAYIVDARVISC